MKQPWDLVFTSSEKSLSQAQFSKNGMMVRKNEWQSNPNLGFWNNCEAPGKAYYRSNYLEKKITVELGDANVSARNGIAPSHGDILTALLCACSPRTDNFKAKIAQKFIMLDNRLMHSAILQSAIVVEWITINVPA